MYKWSRLHFIVAGYQQPTYNFPLGAQTGQEVKKHSKSMNYSVACDAKVTILTYTFQVPHSLCIWESNHTAVNIVVYREFHC